MDTIHCWENIRLNKRKIEETRDFMVKKIEMCNDEIKKLDSEYQKLKHQNQEYFDYYPNTSFEFSSNKMKNCVAEFCLDIPIRYENNKVYIDNYIESKFINKFDFYLEDKFPKHPIGEFIEGSSFLQDCLQKRKYHFKPKLIVYVAANYPKFTEVLNLDEVFLRDVGPKYYVVIQTFESSKDLEDYNEYNINVDKDVKINNIIPNKNVYTWISGRKFINIEACNAERVIALYDDLEYDDSDIENKKYEKIDENGYMVQSYYDAICFNLLNYLSDKIPEHDSYENELNKVDAKEYYEDLCENYKKLNFIVHVFEKKM